MTCNIALWFKSNGGYDIKAEKKKNKTVKVITNQIFGHLQHTKIEVRYLDNIFSGFRSLFSFMSLRKNKFYRYSNQHILTSWQNLWNHKIIDSVTECYWMHPMPPWSNNGWKVKTCTDWYALCENVASIGPEKWNWMECYEWFWK